jgi:hypothetical protein
MAKRRRQSGLQHARCRAQLKRVSRNLEHAIEQSSKRGYTGFVSGRGSAFDDPRVKAVMRKYDALLKSPKCTLRSVRGGRP